MATLYWSVRRSTLHLLHYEPQEVNFGGARLINLGKQSQHVGGLIYFGTFECVEFQEIEIFRKA